MARSLGLPAPVCDTSHWTIAINLSDYKMFASLDSKANRSSTQRLARRWLSSLPRSYIGAASMTPCVGVQISLMLCQLFNACLGPLFRPAIRSVTCSRRIPSPST
jgi:hypothetical protein